MKSWVVWIWIGFGAVSIPQGHAVLTPGGAVFYNPIPERPGYAGTPYKLSGQTVCSKGRVEDRPKDEQRYWFDGASVDLPGHRCVRMK